MKKKIEAYLLPETDPVKNLDTLVEQLDDLVRNPISELNWPAFPYKPAVNFSIAHQENYIFLKYNVSEKNIKTTYLVTNEPVYKDACVEFFIALEDDDKYYNFEFNCIGTCLSAYGTKHERNYLPKHLIETIQHRSSFKLNDGLVHWELTLAIPRELFCHHSLTTFKGLTGRANFYKCGDDLPVPHFLSWNPIQTKEPDFHQPSYFGEIVFIDQVYADHA